MVGHETQNIAQLISQYHHWTQATSRLSNLENLASTFAWNGIDREVRKMIIECLNASINRIQTAGKQIEMQIKFGGDYQRIRASLLRLRQQYLSTETTVHFFTDALNSRTNASVASLLRACDVLCKRSMEAILPGLGIAVPPCFTYLDRGLGASILKSGLRLWDGSISPVAAIKITFHNLYRPTAAVHETGHQVAHLLDWNTELAMQLRERLKRHSPLVANTFSEWASEIAADNFAFVHTGYAAVASLHNVVAGTATSVFAFHEGDPHPIAYLRLLLNIQCCRKFYGKGPWDELEESFRIDYPLDRQSRGETGLIRECEKALPEVVDICLTTRYKAFAGKTLTDIIHPQQVSPKTLGTLNLTSGPLQQSHAWIYQECLKLLALTGYRIATVQEGVELEYKKQEEWMMRLGTSMN